MQNRLLVTLMVTALFFWGGTRAQAITYEFKSITNDNADQSTIGETQFLVDLADYGNNQVLFTLKNEGPTPSIIAAVYFDDMNSVNPLLKDIADLNFGRVGNVLFENDTKPQNLPSPKSFNFTTTRDLQAGSTSHRGTNGNGVDPGEATGILFTLQDGKTFDNVITALDKGDLRIGIHGTALGDEADGLGESESFVNLPRVQVNPVPIPGSVLLLGTGLLGLVVLRKTRRS